jgi:hypothetical protein
MAVEPGSLTKEQILGVLSLLADVINKGFKGKALRAKIADCLQVSPDVVECILGCEINYLLGRMKC